MGQKILKSPGQKNSSNKINQKIFFREIAFLSVLNFFQVQKLIFGYFVNRKKWILVKKIIREIDSTSFLAWTFLNFLAHCVWVENKQSE